ncbi:hypothetical protein [Streptomyces blattellae]|uniref:hypothetical protein n=1 Tax=Streptomyces blattellae TaxID=2569855 RepID=UPI0012B87461|nr:hypothetical protein [Streptomyces blattellae]
MARIKVLEAIAGDNFSWSPGDVVALPDAEAAAWADGHRAVLADDEGQDPGHGAPPLREVPPRVVTSDGLELDVVAVAFEEVAPPDGEDDGAEWGRLTVTVALPEPSPPDSPAPELAEAFDPAAHKVDQVLAYLATADETEVVRVLDAEATGKKRTSIVSARDEILAAARERAAGGEQAAAEKAAEVSRGGGRNDGIETR